MTSWLVALVLLQALSVDAAFDLASERESWVESKGIVFRDADVLLSDLVVYASPGTSDTSASAIVYAQTTVTAGLKDFGAVASHYRSELLRIGRELSNETSNIDGSAVESFAVCVGGNKFSFTAIQGRAIGLHVPDDHFDQRSSLTLSFHTGSEADDCDAERELIIDDEKLSAVYDKSVWVESSAARVRSHDFVSEETIYYSPTTEKRTPISVSTEILVPSSDFDDAREFYLSQIKYSAAQYSDEVQAWKTSLNNLQQYCTPQGTLSVATTRELSSHWRIRSPVNGFGGAVTISVGPPQADECTYLVGDHP